MAERVFRGPGEPTLKSDRLLLVSVQPPDWRTADVVLDSPDAGLPSDAFAFPYPRKSTICDPVGLVPVNEFELLTRATFPSEALKLMPPEPSGVGRDDDPAFPSASWTR